MNTRGYFAIRYGGEHYVMYNSSGSEFRKLGYDLVRSIQGMTNERWELIKKVLRSSPREKNCLNADEERSTPRDSNDKNFLLSVMKNYKGGWVTRREPGVDGWILYVYVIDLDVNVFTVITENHKDEYAEGEWRYNCRFENLSTEWLDSCDSE